MADPSTEELPVAEPAPIDVRALVEEARRRFEDDETFRYQAEVALWLSRSTEYRELDGAVLLGAALALVVADHPEIGASS